MILELIRLGINVPVGSVIGPPFVSSKIDVQGDWVETATIALTEPEGEAAKPLTIIQLFQDDPLPEVLIKVGIKHKI